MTVLTKAKAKKKKKAKLQKDIKEMRSKKPSKTRIKVTRKK